MLRDVELADTGSGNERAAARERAHPHLIVIGSLVDRLPNLGKATDLQIASPPLVGSVTGSRKRKRKRCLDLQYTLLSLAHSSKVFLILVRPQTLASPRPLAGAVSGSSLTGKGKDAWICKA
jgi:hypothetical protein